MLPLPSKINVFKRRENFYYVGLDCVLHDDADELQMARLLLNRINSIITYCNKYRKTVVVICNSKNIPEFLVGMLLTLHVKIQSVLKNPKIDRMYGDYYVSQNPKEFLGKTTSVVIVLKEEEDDYYIENNEKDVPIKELIYTSKKDNPIRTDNPVDIVKDFKKIAIPNNSPYSVFDLGRQGQRVFDDYYKRIMIAPEPTSGPKPLRIGAK